MEDLENLKWNEIIPGYCQVDGCPCLYSGGCANCPQV